MRDTQEEGSTGVRLRALDADLRGLGSVMIAFSGGVDSSFLLAAAVRALGADAVVAATGVSPSLPSHELDGARDFARRLGVRHLQPRTFELSRDGYTANGQDRCFFCKAELMDTLRPLAEEQGIRHVVTGTNADDARDPFRPGIRAAELAGARTPLRDAGLTKAQIREISRDWNLVTAEKPASPCLSSRVVYGLQIDSGRLRRIGAAEQTLRRRLAAHGIETIDLRVRDLGGRARVEVDGEIVSRVAARPDLLQDLEGFDVVELDPRGFRSGSMNEGLTVGA